MDGAEAGVLELVWNSVGFAMEKSHGTGRGLGGHVEGAYDGPAWLELGLDPGPRPKLLPAQRQSPVVAEDLAVIRASSDKDDDGRYLNATKAQVTAQRIGLRRWELA